MRGTIVASSDPDGDTGQVLAEASAPSKAQLESSGKTNAVLISTLTEFREGRGRKFQTIVEQVAAGTKNGRSDDGIY